MVKMYRGRGDMLNLLVTYMINPGHEEEAVQLLSHMVAPTRAEPGNLMYLVHRSVNEPRRFMLYEQYKDQAAFDAHRASEHFQQYITGGIRQIAESRVADVFELLA